MEGPETVAEVPREGGALEETLGLDVAEDLPVKIAENGRNGGEGVKKDASSASKVSGVSGSAKRKGVVGSGVARLSAGRKPQGLSEGVRRNSTGGIGEKQAVMLAKKPLASVGMSGSGRKSGATNLEPLRRSLPETRRSSVVSDGSKSSSSVGVRERKMSGPVSPGGRILKTPMGSSSSKKDTVDKPSFTRFTDSSSRKINSSPSDSTAGSTTKRSVLKLSASSVQSPVIASGLKRGNRLSSPSARSPSLSSVVKNGSLSSSRDKSLNLSGQKRVVSAEQKDSRFIVLPQVEIKAGDDLRLDLRGQRIRCLTGSGTNLSLNLEFVYLRDNLLSSLEGIEILKNVKVLDLSFNDFKGPGFEPLENCKALQQLYLAGNQITSLLTLPELPNLEFLSVAHNKLRSLSMASQPRLQVLAASKNKISSLKGFPYLPALEHLRVEENPILRMRHLEAASVLLVGPTLKKFNDRDLSEQEVVLSTRYPPHTALCIRDGWELCSPEQAAESTFQFLMDRWSEQLPPGFHLREASIDPPFEEDASRCHFIFLRDHDIDSKLVLKYQWYVGDRVLSNFKAISDAVSEVYCPKHDEINKFLKVECVPCLGEKEYPPIFAISSQVAPGTGYPKVLNLDIRGDLVEGSIIRGLADIAWCGGTPEKGISSWLRRKWNSSPMVIPGAEDEEYQLSIDDVGSSLVYMYTPVTKEGTKGQAQYAITDFVKAAPPSVSNVRIIGDLMEGNIVKGAGEYFGGREGPSKFEWMRDDKDTGASELVLTGAAEYALTGEDVSHRMTFTYVPVNFEGKEGEPASAVSAIVRQAPPKVTNTRILGALREGSKITVTGTVTGGTEGSSRVQWFKSSSFNFLGEVDLEALSTCKVAKAFRIPLGAVGHYIVAKFTPMTPDGESGQPAYVVSEKTVQTLPPSLNFLSITGDYLEGEILTASYGYVGGHEGKSIYNWYLHEGETDKGALIEEVSEHLQFQIPKEAIGKFVSFECIPVRDDGMVGEPGVCFGHERVRAGGPRLISLQIVGEPMEGSTLLTNKRYWGGEEGDSIFRWFRTGPDDHRAEINGANSASYTLSTDDIGCCVSISCEPIRRDWARGPVFVSDPYGPVVPGPPTCQALEFSGLMREGQKLTLIASYSGGEKGNCCYEWFRVIRSGNKEKLSVDESLDLTLEDVGCCIEVVFTPVRSDGARGTPRTAISDVIIPADPEGLELAISNCCEGKEVLPLKRYFGGHEGVGHFIWYRTKDKVEESSLSSVFDTNENLVICGEKLSYSPCLDDVGAYLILHWIPVREDGKRGKPLVSICNDPVAPAHPAVTSIWVKALSLSTYAGEGQYFGGHEGPSLFSWYRETADGVITLINGANSQRYEVSDSDYNCRLLFGYTPVRSDSVVGELRLSESTDVILPEKLKMEMIALVGKAMEGEVLTAVEVIPNSERQQVAWSKFKKDVKYQWYYSSGDDDSLERVSSQTSCSYKLRFEDIGRCLRCECIVTDVFGRSSEPAHAESSLILPGVPRIDKLEIEGRGLHTNLYAVRGIYSGGKEGKSRIQWLRSMVGSPDHISIPGETGRMYEANVDDVGYRLVVVYTPVREDGVEGLPVSASTEPILVEPDVLEEVKKKLDLGSVKFEVLCDKAPKSKKVFDIGGLERRVLEINRKRVKVIKPGSKTSFPTTEMRGTYAPPFHVELLRNDQHRLRVVVDSENEVDVMVHTRHLRDVIVLVLRNFAQKFNSTSLNSLLKIET